MTWKQVALAGREPNESCWPMIVILPETCQSISWYQTGLQGILEKKEGNIHINNLQAILLMEGDFNRAMKILLGSHMICLAQHLALIPAECYGSHPGCTAIQVSLGRTLTADVTRQSWATLAVASVDCRTCYDSVSHPPVSITCQRLGVSPAILETIFSSIQSMNIFLHTAHGDSSSLCNGISFTGLPFQGVCQGNGAGPALWLTTSIPLIESLCHHGHLATFMSPISHHQVLLVGFLYVNNCDRLAFGVHNIPHNQVISALQNNILLWQGGLRATGAPYPLKNVLGVSFPTTGKVAAGYYATISPLPLPLPSRIPQALKSQSVASAPKRDLK